MEAAGRCGPVASNDARSLGKGDSWFGTFDAVVDIKRTLGHEMILSIKTGFSKTPKKEVKQIMMHWPTGSYLVFLHTVDKDLGVGENLNDDVVELIFVAYKYNCRTVLCFLMTKDAGSTVPDPSRPYFAVFPDRHGNLLERPVARPAFLSHFFRIATVLTLTTTSDSTNWHWKSAGL